MYGGATWDKSWPEQGSVRIYLKTIPKLSKHQMQLRDTLCNVHLAINNTINFMSQSLTPCILLLCLWTTILPLSAFADKLCAKSFVVALAKRMHVRCRCQLAPGQYDCPPDSCRHFCCSCPVALAMQQEAPSLFEHQTFSYNSRSLSCIWVH